VASGEPAIARYAAPRRPSGLLILLVSFVVIISGAIVWTSLGGSDDPVEPTTATSPSPTSTPTAVERKGGTAIDQAGVTGYWKITSTRWRADRVTLQLSVTVDEGLLVCQFFAFDDVTAEILAPEPGGADALDTVMYVSPGQTLTGTVTFITSRRDLTLVISDGKNQLSALNVSA